MASIEVDGLGELLSNFDKMGSKSFDNAMAKEVKRSSNDTLKYAKEKLKTNKQVASKATYNSGIVEKVDDNTFEVQFNSEHAYYVEFGRKSGKQPPIVPIMEWVRIRGIAKGEDIKGVAFAIARSIGEKGTASYRGKKPFLFPSFERGRKELMTNIVDAFRAFTSKFR